jgi:hypothetical protein
MRLVLVSRRGSTRVVELGDPRLRLCIGALLLVALGTCAGSGAALALRLRRPAGAAREAVALGKRIEAQRERLVTIRRDARRDVNALGVSFARLQAGTPGVPRWAPASPPGWISMPMPNCISTKLPPVPARLHWMRPPMRSPATCSARRKGCACWSRTSTRGA